MAINPPRLVAIGTLCREPAVFQVPKYQRDYAWDMEQIDDFCKDIARCHFARTQGQVQEHFFGGLISINTKVPGTGYVRCQVVDGQQRLATFLLLISRLASQYLVMATKRRKARDTGRADLFEQRAKRLQSQWLEYEGEENRKPITISRITLSGPDAAFYQALLDNADPAASRESHNRLLLAQKRIDELLQEILKPCTINKKIDALDALEEVLNDDCTVIHITTTHSGEAYRLFQVLNDRGMHLTEGDLLRAIAIHVCDAGMPIR